MCSILLLCRIKSSAEFEDITEGVTYCVNIGDKDQGDVTSETDSPQEDSSFDRVGQYPRKQTYASLITQDGQMTSEKFARVCGSGRRECGARMQGGRREKSFRGNHGRGKFTPLTGELRGRTDKRCRDYDTCPRPQQTYNYTCGQWAYKHPSS